MHVLIAGGGTGGHVFPGIAVAEELLSRNAQHQVLFVGTRRGVEVKAVPQAGFALECIDVGGLKGTGLTGWVIGLSRIPRAVWQSRRILKRFSPDVVLGVGGYASGPVILAALWLRVPTAIMEQNALPGLTNKVLGRVARRAFVSFPESVRYFSPSKTLITGNPVRRSLLESSRAAGAHSSGSNLLIFGGSQGASVLNRVVPEAVRTVHRSVPDLKVVHQSGARELLQVQQCYQGYGLAATVLPFIDDMAAAYRDADIVVCRAGATSVAELTLCGKASIFIPFARAADNHQEVNARALVAAGAAIMIRESELTSAKLADSLLELLRDSTRRAAMEQTARRLGRPDAARQISDAVVELAARTPWRGKERG
jgi:UDP-N-acetylglucosamine--N-acetylmuramyl-(pentapeptide) pyrophosphoryl-undecaprenol N-acetylglucosamine transferase